MHLVPTLMAIFDCASPSPFSCKIRDAYQSLEVEEMCVASTPHTQGRGMMDERVDCMKGDGRIGHYYWDPWAWDMFIEWQTCNC